MTTIKLSTVEGHEIELDVADHAKLCSWPDLDLSCIHVVGDDALHALKPSTGKLHGLSLEEMLKVGIKPCNACHRDLPETVFPTSKTSPGYRNTCAPCRSAKRRAQRAEDAPPSKVPVPGPAGPLLRRYAHDPTLPIAALSVIVDGEPREVPVVSDHNGRSRVPLCDPDRVFAGFAHLDTGAFKLLTSPWLKASRRLWTLQPNGEVITRATTYLGGLGTYSVRRLLRDHGITAPLAVQRIAYPQPVKEPERH